MSDAPYRKLLHRTTHPDDSGWYDEYWLDSGDPCNEVVIHQRMIPNAHASGAPLIREIRKWECWDFMGEPLKQPRIALQKILDKRYANRAKRAEAPCRCDRRGSQVMRIATGEIEEDTPVDDDKDANAKALGANGGRARADAMAPERRAAIAKAAAVKRWAKN